MTDIDPTVLPIVPVIGLMEACDANDPDWARSVLHPDLIDEIETQMGWPEWWEYARSRFSGYSDADKWAITMTMTADLDRPLQWPAGRRVSIADRSKLPTQPGSMTAGGEPFKELAYDVAAGEWNCWVTETGDGWRIQGFGISRLR